MLRSTLKKAQILVEKIDILQRNINSARAISEEDLKTTNEGFATGRSFLVTYPYEEFEVHPSNNIELIYLLTVERNRLEKEFTELSDEAERIENRGW